MKSVSFYEIPFPRYRIVGVPENAIEIVSIKILLLKL